MDAAALEAESRTLRAELKAWENGWARAHAGAKPDKAAIKRDPDIEHKYKLYSQVRDALAGKKPKERPPQPSPKKRKSIAEDVATPSSKRTRLVPTETPSRNHHNPAEDDPDATTPAISRTLFSPVLPSSIGPTPQRDGKVLGLFGMLPPPPGTPAASATPSRKRGVPVPETPSRGARGGRTPDHDENTTTTNTPQTGRHHRRTPMSTSKRQLLDTFLTPLKRSSGNSHAARTPSAHTGGVSKLQFDTPAFLRRAPLPAMANDVAPLRLPRKPIGRTLSSIVANLRQMEEEALDEELEAMREMEMEEESERAAAAAATGERGQMGPEGAGESGGQDGVDEGGVVEEAPEEDSPEEDGEEVDDSEVEGGFEEEEEVNSEEGDAEPDATEEAPSVEGKASKKKGKQTPRDALDDIPADLLAKDHQHLLGGFDDEAEVDGPVEEQLDRNGKPLRVFKKKGQKRTTRLHRMKPVQVKRPAAVVAEAGGEDSGEDDAAARDGDGDGSEFEEASAAAAEGETVKRKRGRPPKKTSTAAKTKATTAKGGATKTKAKARPKKKEAGSDGEGDGDHDDDDGGDDDDSGDDGAPKKKGTTGRKVNALAHANFRRLKLRNSGSKGGPGYNSRFRRRR